MTAPFHGVSVNGVDPGWSIWRHAVTYISPTASSNCTKTTHIMPGRVAFGDPVLTGAAMGRGS